MVEGSSRSVDLNDGEDASRVQCSAVQCSAKKAMKPPSGRIYN